MTPSLEGCYIKLERAKDHMDSLHWRLRPLLDDNVFTAVLIETPYEAKTGQFRPKVVHTPEIPPILSAIAGDIIHNLRSALDHLAYQVTALHPCGPYEDSQFPIVDSLSGLSSNPRFKKTLEFFTDPQRAIVERNQVYQRADDYRTLGLAQDLSAINNLFRFPNLPLRDLRDISNWDKHRLLLPRYLVAQNPKFILSNAQDCTPTESMRRKPIILEPGAEIALFWANATGPNPKVDVDLQFKPHVGIYLADDARETLHAIAAKTLGIVREFEPFF